MGGPKETAAGPQAREKIREGPHLTGVEQIRERILQEAEEAARVRLELASGRAEKMKESARREAGQKKKAMLEAAGTKAADIRRRTLALAEIELRKERLSVRQQLMKTAFDKTREKLCSMPEEEYIALLAGMILRVTEQEDFEIVLSLKDRERIGSRLMAKLSEEAADTGKKVRFRLSERTAGICGGFILRTEELEMNYSFEAILRTEQEKLEELACRRLGLI
jgi:V/A-type H+-transporting ATPase subunit E